MLKSNRIKIGAYSPILTFDEEHIKLLAEAGVDFAIYLMDHVENIPLECREKILHWMEKYKIEAAIRDASFDKVIDGANVLDFEKTDEMFFKDSPVFSEYAFMDEPGACHFDVLGESVSEFKKQFPTKDVYINLLPMYANVRQLLNGPWEKGKREIDDEYTYRMYLDEFVEKVDIESIGADIYPCKRKPHKDCPEEFPLKYTPVTYDKYLHSIEAVADKCRETGRKFYATIQTCAGEGVYRKITPDELRWQAYTMLSFGAKAIIYFTFARRKESTCSILDEKGNPTELFYASKKMCEGIKKLSDLYCSYKNIGAFTVGYDEEKTPYLYLENPYSLGEFGIISEIDTNTPLLIGCFDKEHGEGKAFMIVNQQDWSQPMDAVIKMKIEGKVTKYYDGEPEEMKAKDGVYEFNLAQGDGLFVTVE